MHSQEKEEATKKAKDLIRMAVAKARLIQPLDEPVIDVIPRGLVIGGGLAGMTAALSLADQGFECCLVEKKTALAGNLRNIYYTLQGENPRAYLKKIIERVNQHERIKVFTNAEVQSVDGFVGNFRTVFFISQDGGRETVELEHGILILATGAKAFSTEQIKLA